MATLFLERRLLVGGRLPQMCIVCGGRPATEKAGSLDSIGMVASAPARLPFCASHWEATNLRSWIYAIGVFVVLGLIVLTGAGAFFLRSGVVCVGGARWPWPWPWAWWSPSR